MNKMRENTSVVLWILVFAFGVVWVLKDAGTFDATGAQRTGEIAVVNGSPIAYADFQRTVEGRVRQFEQRTGQPVTQQQRSQIQQQTYDALIQNQLIRHAMHRLDVSVTDEEVVALIRGENPHPVIQRLFSNGQGGVDYRLLNNFRQNRPERWIQIENMLRQQRRREKLQQLIGATVHVTEQEVEAAYRRGNRTLDVRYVALPYAQVPASAVEITEEDLRAYYEEHREDYRRERSYTVEYAALRKAPTAEDTAAVVGDLEALRPEFAQAENDSLFLARQASEQPFSSAYVNPSQLSAALADAIFAGGAEAGTIVGPVVAGGQAHLVKIRDVRPAGETYVHARHILFQGENEGALREEALQVKEQLQQGASFAELARRYSDGPSAVRGGDLGWFGPGQMVEPFSEAAFSAEVGEVVGPVETRYGLHLIKVVGRADEAVQIADLALPLRPSVATINDLQGRLGDLAYYASQNGSFAEEARRQNVEIQEVRVTADQTRIPGIGASPALARFLETAEAGAVSEVIELNDRFVVVHVAEITPAGYRPFEEVKAQVRSRVLTQKRQAVQLQKLEQALAQNEGLEAGAAAVGTEVREQQGLSASTRAVPVIGSDPAFVGTALGLEEGQTSRAVAGENAAFAIAVTAVNAPPPITEADREQIRNQLQQQRRRQLMQAWLDDLREQAEIVDNRAAYL